MLHALGIDPDTEDKDAGRQLNRMQDAVFDEIVRLRACLAIDLLRIPCNDLAELTRRSDLAPATDALLKSLRRYVSERSIEA